MLLFGWFQFRVPSRPLAPRRSKLRRSSSPGWQPPGGPVAALECLEKRALLSAAPVIDNAADRTLDFQADDFLTFNGRQTFARGADLHSVTTADLTGDGRPDLIMTDARSNTVSVWTNTTAAGAARPTFGMQQTFAVGSDPTAVTVADVNGDGRPDLIVTDAGSNSVSVLLNTTTPRDVTPNFGNQVTFATGSHPMDVAAADLNGDGRADLIVTNRGSNSASVLLNFTRPQSASPNFGRQQTFAVGSDPQAVAAADLNGDGRADLIVADRRSNAVSVLLNFTAPQSLTPNFAREQTFTVGSHPQDVTTADLNDDGRPDLVVTNAGSNSVSVLLNGTAPGASMPTFGMQTTFSVGSHPLDVVAADLDGDGRPDLVVTNAGSNSVSALLNTTSPRDVTPNFGNQVTFSVGSHPLDVAAADFNGDGRLDLVVTDRHSVTLLLNMTAPGPTLPPGFGAQQTFALGTDPSSTTAADFQGDVQTNLSVGNRARGKRL